MMQTVEKSTHVLLIFGGESNEHEVSIMGARNVDEALDKEKYQVSYCYIDKIGRWYQVDGVDTKLSSSPKLVPIFGQRSFLTVPGQKYLRPDVMLPILHGKNGEDGTIQSVAQLLHISCVGPGVLDAAVTMNKDVTRRLLRDAGLPVGNWMVWRPGLQRPTYAEVVGELGEILFVKPSASGSSVGVSKVRNSEEFDTAMSKAIKHDSTVMIEEYTPGREIEVSVLGNEQIYVSDPGEILPGEEFYSYADKYDSKSKARIDIPAKVSEKTRRRLREVAEAAYLAVCGQGMARVDMFLGDNEDIVIGEINSIPGFTNISMYPKLWQHQGVSYPDLVDSLISLALEK